MVKLLSFKGGASVLPVGWSLCCQLTLLLFPRQQCEDKWGHLCALADFAIALNESIQEINKHSFNNFELRIGKSSQRRPLGDVQLAELFSSV